MCQAANRNQLGPTHQHKQDHAPRVGRTLGLNWLSRQQAPQGSRQRSIERYAELLRSYVLPTLGERPLQRLQSSEIDYLYVSLADKISQRTLQHVHSTLGACLGTAMRTGKITKNPMTRLEKVPAPKEPDHGMVLDQDQLRDLVQGFRDRTFFPMVAAAAFTGARRNEILALRWDDLDVASKTLRIERALEVTAKYGSRFKEPKTARGKRTIAIDEDLIALLVAGRENHLRIVACVPDGAKVDLSLVKLPTDAPMFPGEDFTRPRHPNAVSKEFKRKPTRLGFPVCGFTIFGAHTKPCYSTRASPFMSLPPAAGTIRPCYCGAMPSERKRLTCRPRPYSVLSPAVCCPENGRRTNSLANR